MSRKYIGVIVAVVITFGVGYFISQSSNQSTSQTNVADISNSTTSSKTLDKSGQQLTDFPEEVLQQTDTTVLDISNNQLTTIPASIVKLVNLQVLNVENNRLESIAPEINQLKNLHEILANNNRMRTIPDELSTMTWLKRIDFSGNDIPASEINQLQMKLPNTEIKS